MRADRRPGTKGSHHVPHHAQEVRSRRRRRRRHGRRARAGRRIGRHGHPVQRLPVRHRQSWRDELHEGHAHRLLPRDLREQQRRRAAGRRHDLQHVLARPRALRPARRRERPRGRGRHARWVDGDESYRSRYGFTMPGGTGNDRLDVMPARSTIGRSSTATTATTSSTAASSATRSPAARRRTSMRRAPPAWHSLNGGPGADRIDGGADNDFIYAKDSTRRTTGQCADGAPTGHRSTASGASRSTPSTPAARRSQPSTPDSITAPRERPAIGGPFWRGGCVIAAASSGRAPDVRDAVHRKARPTFSPDRELSTDRAISHGVRQRRPADCCRLLTDCSMELGGLEPPTSWVRSRRSPN